jgi:very-short-patch-repair endonuclease
VANEWHPTKNGKLSPENVTSRNNRKVWWLCPNGHTYPSLISDRVRGVGCPKCSPKTSRIEIRVLTELMTMFDEVLHRQVFDDEYECDIFIPKYNLGIEIDGYWHKVRTERDKEKLDYFKQKGLYFVRLRDRRLKLNENDIPYSENEKHVKVIRRLLTNLLDTVSFSQQDEENIRNYIQQNKLQNQREYQRRTRFIKTVSPRESLSFINPKLASEWDWEKNHPLVPSSFAPNSHSARYVIRDILGML